MSLKMAGIVGRSRSISGVCSFEGLRGPVPLPFTFPLGMSPLLVELDASDARRKATRGETVDVG